jgi:chromosomal replication initiation ATPase DnaA
MKQPHLLTAALLAAMLAFPDVTKEVLLSGNRARDVVRARQACWWALRKAGALPSEIAGWFGCHRTRVSAGLRTCEEQSDTYPQYGEQVFAVNRYLNL